MSPNKEETKKTEFDKMDQILLQLKTISRELIFQNAQAKTKFFKDKNVSKIYELCTGVITKKELVSKSGLSLQQVENVLLKLVQSGFVQHIGGSNMNGGTGYGPTDPHHSTYYIVCIGGHKYIYNAYPCANTNYTYIWGPYLSEAEANAHLGDFSCG